MRIAAILGALALASTTVAQKRANKGHGDDSWKKDPGSAERTGATRKYIIEVDHDTGAANLGNHLNNLPGNRAKPVREFNCSDIFSGLSIETESENVDTLRRMAGVTNVWPLNSVPLPQTINGQRIGPDQRPQNYSVHQWTGVDRLHTQGIRGKGATVAIIDTGIDYKHKTLGGCFGPGCKVIGGYDLVGATWDPHDEDNYPLQPDDDPKDQYGHGTHIAGIVAGENDWFTGVAPDSELLVYKVFADEPFDTDEGVLIQAFCDAYSSGADVITASIGTADGFEDNPWATVANRMVEKGIVVTISAGNEGYSGPFYASSGSSGHNVLAVAAINVTSNPNISTTDPGAIPLPAYFTTWGPSNELLMKPSIGAPGYSIFSAWINQSFQEQSGTSMSAPYIAGIAALFIGEHGGREIHGADFAKMLSQRIISSGRSVAWSADKIRLNHTAPPWQVGTGLVDAGKILHYNTRLSFEPMALLDTEMFKPRWRADIMNGGKKPVSYSFQHEPQAGIEIADSTYGVSSIFKLRPKKISPRVKLPPPVRIQPGRQRSVEFVFNLPRGVDDDALPLYGGKILVKGDNGEKLSIPYGGAAYDTEKAFDTMFPTEPVVHKFNTNWSYSFNVEKNSFDFVELGARLGYPCFHLRWDIYNDRFTEDHWRFPPQIGKNGYIGSATSMRDAGMYWFYDGDTMDKDDTVSFPLMRVARGFRNFWWFGKLANGTQIAPGNYTMRFAALRPYGDPNISDHWDIMRMEVPTIEVRPYNATDIMDTRVSGGYQGI